MDWHIISVDEVLRRLAVSLQTGLDDAQYRRRLTAYGKNVIPPPPNRILRRIAGWIFGGFGTLLLAAAIVCFIAWYVSESMSFPSFHGPHATFFIIAILHSAIR